MTYHDQIITLLKKQIKHLEDQLKNIDPAYEMEQEDLESAKYHIGKYQNLLDSMYEL